jgi:hypothetical protein
MRHLFGPVDRGFADLRTVRDTGSCLTFGDGADLDLSTCIEWADVEARLPDGWRPDFHDGFGRRLCRSSDSQATGTCCGMSSVPLYPSWTWC